jgi:hypothetical protein
MELERLHDRVSGQIHERLRFEQYQAMACKVQFTGKTRESFFGNGNIFQMRKTI